MNRNCDLIRHILKYCQSIKSTILRFGDDFDTFNTDIDYRNSVCMSIIQIGELSRRLSEDYKNEKSEIPWKQIIGLRNICAHAYNTVDYEGIFEIAHSDIDELKKFCECELQFIELINQPENQNSYDDEEFEL